MSQAQSTLYLADHPIDTAKDDLLSRSGLAKILATELREIPAEQGSVAAITGDWGSGKTSLLNMVREQLRGRDDVTLVTFNPWLFAGVEQLTVSFLTELGRQLSGEQSKPEKYRDAVAGVAAKVSDYAASLSVLRLVPFGGAALDAVDGVAKAAKMFAGDDPSIEARRDAITNLLSELQGRIIVLVDDIDRLSSEETKDLFRVIRLTASFPNMVYLLCLDMNVVRLNLTSNGVDGRDYLAKILTVTCQIPSLPQHVKRKIFLESLNDVLARHPHGVLDERRWSDSYVTLIERQVRTLRDAKRLLASLPFVLESVADEVDIVDVLVLETLRIMRPDAWDTIRRHAAALTAVRPSSGSTGQEQDQAVDEVVHVMGKDQGRELITQLFPSAAARVGGETFDESWHAIWYGDKLVAHHKILRFYFEREYEPEVAPTSAVDRAIRAMQQGAAQDLQEALGSLAEHSLEDALDRMLGAVEEVPPESVPAVIPLLFDLFPSLRAEANRGMLDFGSEFVVTRLALRLLRKLDEGAVTELADYVIQHSNTLFGAFEMESLVGHRENAGHQLVSQVQDEYLKAKLRDRLASTAAEDLATERHLVRILYHVLNTAEVITEGPALPQLSNLSLASAVLRNAVSPVRSQTLGNSHVSTTYRLNWDILVELFGSEEDLASAVTQVRIAHPDPDEALDRAIKLYDRYASGWRPEDFRGSP